MGKAPLKGINSSADTNEAACFHLLQLWAAMSALDSAACAPSTADHKSCSRNSTNESTENPFPAWHSYWNRTHCETVKIISCIFQSDQMFYSCKIFIARNIVYQDIIWEGSQTLSNSVIWCIYDECAGEHSEVQVGVVFFVLSIYFSPSKRTSSKRQQKAQKCPGYLKKNQSVQSEVTALAVLTATPHPESHAKPKCKVNLPHELTSPYLDKDKRFILLVEEPWNPNRIVLCWCYYV